MAKSKRNRVQRRELQAKALKRLQSPYFFNEFIKAERRIGLVGETSNALVLLIVVVSRLLPRPLSAFVKGVSSAGKNWLAKCVLTPLSKRSITELTSASDKAFQYSGSDLKHHVVYLHERNDAAGSVHPMRLLISEGKLVRIVPRWVAGRLVTKKYVARGPVASISTTTKNRLEIDEETRNVSIWVNESVEQTREIAKAYTKQNPKRRSKERRIWREIHRLLESRIGNEITFPKWWDRVAELLFVDDLRVRRYYPAFVEACRTVCLIRSFLPDREYVKGQPLEVEFADFHPQKSFKISECDNFARKLSRKNNVNLCSPISYLRNSSHFRYKPSLSPTPPNPHPDPKTSPKPSPASLRVQRQGVQDPHLHPLHLRPSLERT